MVTDNSLSKKQDKTEVVTVQIIMEVTVERYLNETDAVTAAYVHDAVSDWFDEGLEYETKVVDPVIPVHLKRIRR